MSVQHGASPQRSDQDEQQQAMEAPAGRFDLG